MSKRFKARDKVTHKMTKDGVALHNATTGENTRVSKREADMRFGGGLPKDDKYIKAGSTAAVASPKHRKQTYRHSKSEIEPETKPDVAPEEPKTGSSHIDGAYTEPMDTVPVYAAPDAKPASTLEAAKTGSPYRSVTNARYTDTASRPAPPDTKPPSTPGTPTPTPYGHDITADPTGIKSAAAPRPEKSGRLQFAKNEAVPDIAAKRQASAGRRLAKPEHGRNSEKSAKSQGEMPRKRNPVHGKAKGGGSGTAGQKLKFEKTLKKQGQMKGTAMALPVTASANVAVAATHGKLSQHEDDNVAVKAAHHAEMEVEAGVKAGMRYIKAAPYRKVRKMERATARKQINHAYRQGVARNPNLQSNVVSRALQKRKIRNNYAKSLRDSRKAAKKAGSIANRAGKAIAAVVKRHPIAAAVAVMLVLFGFVTTSLFNAGSTIGGGSVTTIILTTYLADDADMLGAEAVYAGMEAELQNTLDNYEELNPGYDEYRFELDPIQHDPYVLISILHALHDGEWKLGDVLGTLDMLFDLQYILTEEVTTEIRTRTETKTVTDPETGETHEEEVEVEYEYHIITVTLENFNLSHLPVYVMSTERLGRYALLMRTLGNRPDLFEDSPSANLGGYLKYEIPPDALGDEVFARMIAEAEKYLGWPYVWGGSSPATSFDCSGYVSWVINNSGWNMGRLTAQGLFNNCIPVSSANARPGDLIFFTGTYRSPGPVSHVGIYVGGGHMIHCGNPISYADITTPYWVRHFYAFARLP